MIIGIPKEIKDQENRVGAPPSAVREIIKAGNKVLVQSGAGLGIGKTDEDYIKAGAEIVSSKEELWEKSQMIYKVKEPIEAEYKLMREGQIVFCYLHLAADRALTQKLLEKGVTALAFETLEVNNSLPLLKPMSEIGGCLAVNEGAVLLTNHRGGKGKLLQGLPGVAPAHVVVVGGGIAGTGAVRTALGIGARVTVLDNNVERLADLADIYGSKLETVYSNDYNVRKAVESADLVVGAVLTPGGRSPVVVTEEMVMDMEEGSVIVDISIDQGGCVETMDRPTTHTDPTYTKHGIIHYAVANIPGVVSRSSTYALSNVTTDYAIKFASMSAEEILKDSILKTAVNTYQGDILCPGVKEAFKDL